MKQQKASISKRKLVEIGDNEFTTGNLFPKPCISKWEKIIPP